ncbi:hypothetical protein VP1G_10981 [Cytospora mali]|uniref:Uncharacterized protein n=1 Tax=Cytospora mali TaxID=578113 RepID=A0A194UZC4_CYTMA|nr:hypothetical protein VP1G_10981 [Valsa mali var. pyri (nom. inval.)]
MNAVHNDEARFSFYFYKTMERHMDISSRCVARHDPLGDLSNWGPQQRPESWYHLLDNHYELLQSYLVFIAQVSISSPENINKWALPQRVWNEGILPVLDFLEKHSPESDWVRPQFTNSAAFFVILFHEAFPDYKENWLEYLLHLGIHLIELHDAQSEMHVAWNKATSILCKGNESNGLDAIHVLLNTQPVIEAGQDIRIGLETLFKGYPIDDLKFFNWSKLDSSMLKLLGRRPRRRPACVPMGELC